MLVNTFDNMDSDKRFKHLENAENFLMKIDNEKV